MEDTQVHRFAFRYSRWWGWFFTALGLGPRFSCVVLTPDRLRTRMGWAFRASIPRSSIKDPKGGTMGWYGIGVHSNLKFKTWLVNGSAKGIVWLTIDPSAWARVGPFRVGVTRLGLGLEDPDGFSRTLGVPATT